MKYKDFCGQLWGLAAILFISLSFFICGCRGGTDESLGVDSDAALTQTPPSEVALVGMDVCSYCHMTSVTDWLEGSHGNLHSHGPASGTLDSKGFPSYEDFYEGGKLEKTENGFYCSSCHDPAGDGMLLQTDVTGNVPRPVIGCESCHGGGAEHYGVGDIPYPAPGASQCGQCHSSKFPPGHSTYHPNGDDILEEYQDSPHASSINEHNYEENSDKVRARCGRCHTDEGYRGYAELIPGTAGHDSIVDYYEGDPDTETDDVPPVEDPSNITCRTCHDPHEASPDDLERLEADTDGSGRAESRQFNTCTACHQLVNQEGTVLSGSSPLNGDSFGYHDPNVNPYGNKDEIIVDSHAAVPGDTRGNWFVDAGGDNKSGEDLIFVDKASDNACSSCHNPHTADNTPNREWVRSGHGNPTAEAWIHYNWKEMTGGWSGTGRQACQRCHTSTGFASFADSQLGDTAYDPAADNDFSHLSPDPYVSGGTTVGKNESLYCSACHAAVRTPHGRLSISQTVKFKDELRNPGKLTPVALFNAEDAAKNLVLYGNTPFSGDTVITGSPAITDGSTIVRTTPDPAGSNVCISCHSGQENGKAVMDAGINWGSTSTQTVINSHYLAAAGVLYRESGYEYINEGYTHEEDYGNAGYFEHDEIGTSALSSTTVAEATGEHGPCAGCHMHANPEKHLFSPVKHDGSTVKLVSTACATCHDASGHPLDGEDIEHEKEAYHASLLALENQLAANGFNYIGHYPYFSEKDWTLSHDGTTQQGTASESRYGQNNMGAAFNFNLLHHEPGAFAHNRFYTKRLIYDSIDWLDDNNMNASVDGSLGNLLNGDTLSEARAYLLDNGGRP